MSKKQILKLKETFNAARRRGRLNDALDALEELQDLEPTEARWPHQRGEIFRRLGERESAVAAYERATELYSKGGFVARAAAMAKSLLQLDPSREEILEVVDPSEAKRVHRARLALSDDQGADSASAAADDMADMAPEVAEGDASDRHVPFSLTRRAEPLQLAEDIDDDEIRFVDADEVGLELDLAELEFLDEPPPTPDEPHAQEGPSLERLSQMSSFPLLAELPQALLTMVLTDADLVELPAGEWAVRRGEPADALFCIAQGSVRVHVPGIDQHPKLDEGDVFGESCLLEQARRQANVRVEENLVALRIPKTTLDRVVQEAPEIDDVLFALLARRLVANVMVTSPLFTAFSPQDRRKLARRFELRRAKVNTLLLERGKRSDGLYILAQGRVHLRGKDEQSVRGPGTLLGIGSLFSREPSNLDAETLTEAIVLRLAAKQFNAFAATFPPALAHLATLAAEAGGLKGSSSPL